MTLLDPTSGAGYATGARLPSADMTTIATQQPDAVDGVAGGSYTPTAPIQILGAQGIQVANLVLNAGGTATISGSATWQGTTLPLLAGRSYNRICDTATGQPSAHFTFSASAGLWVQSDIAAAGTLWWGLSLLDQAVLTDVTIRIHGARAGGGHSSGQLTGTAPTLTVYRQDDGATTSLGTATDTQVGAGQYDVAHNIAVTGLTEAVNETSTPRHYVVKYTGETGGNSVANTTAIIRLYATYTATNLTPGG